LIPSGLLGSSGVTQDPGSPADVLLVPELLSDPAAADLASAVIDTWEGMFGLSVSEHDEYAPDESELTAIVHISGDIEWAVVLRLPVSLARVVAGAMFDCEGSDLGAEEVTDAVGEVANVIGGVVKGRVAGHTTLSLPSVTEGRELRVAVPGTTVAAEYIGRCEHAPFSISILIRPAK